MKPKSDKFDCAKVVASNLQLCDRTPKVWLHQYNHYPSNWHYQDVFHRWKFVLDVSVPISDLNHT